ncbi:hypothetical protein A2686_02545 [Candidatus Woesebacteria bacterium RIFCSPHIGHO2_01_FULL_38_10]|uniref:Type II secretion system protein GspG C-terminal domain-containing protein n=1 Tax=Candidatus Woesebacteria bacterium RIFCSPLOWO2_01_FULL_39_10b TaxID=1802517 RepID=A0A1F8B8V2_9BACT|nr:MAG: hypothetical protein A2686_02545 [Candidatus Woesebacteria bacterium RIFCSPHIGHO2_01_FULL_38_10]OGM60447.1 MAG: hypothetical protein A2892_00235 [Candidatus Woesebacteria bacterium RIFCSPLOWO2_01_FULL_39_10b]
MKKISNISYGFTLIELLIVISIIAVLTGISIFAMQNARRSGRDARRKADLETIRAALEIYKADCNQYPASLPAPGSQLQATCTGVTNIYLRSVPGDPSTLARYVYCPSGVPSTSYNLYSHLEDSSDTFTGCVTCDPTPCRYQLLSP